MQGASCDRIYYRWCACSCGHAVGFEWHTLKNCVLDYTYAQALMYVVLPCCCSYDGQNPQYMVLRSPLMAPMAAGAAPVFTSTLWGPTCDSADCVYKDVPLPLLRNGDWLCFPNAGAYTVAGACDFNGIGMTTPRLFYVYSDHMAGQEHVQAEGNAADADMVA